jgi:hypothetical protein
MRGLLGSLRLRQRVVGLARDLLRLQDTSVERGHALWLAPAFLPAGQWRPAQSPLDFPVANCRPYKEALHSVPPTYSLWERRRHVKHNPLPALEEMKNDAEAQMCSGLGFVVFFF